MRRPASDIPENVTETELHEYHEERHHIFFRVTQCILGAKVVGQRAYDGNGRLMRETPLKNGRKQGREFIWDEEGHLESVEPYVDGQLHGLAKQYNRKGRVMGTYRFVHGTGFDIWRYEREDGMIVISEIHSIRNSVLHGFEWWLRDDQQSVWHECHWQEGKFHGIERIWNREGRLKKGYPKYWIQNRAVSKRVYMKAAGKDRTLPRFSEQENQPRRRFPKEVGSPS
jgi:antitoxin component YwqK of YwqJK toxin-antitoxin module